MLSEDDESVTKQVKFADKVLVHPVEKYLKPSDVAIPDPQLLEGRRELHRVRRFDDLTRLFAAQQRFAREQRQIFYDKLLNIPRNIIAVVKLMLCCLFERIFFNNRGNGATQNYDFRHDDTSHRPTVDLSSPISPLQFSAAATALDSAQEDKKDVHPVGILRRKVPT